jgi:hypothetical protein
MRTLPPPGEFLTPRPRQLPKPNIPRRCTNQSKAADQQAAITAETLRRIGNTIDEIQTSLDRIRFGSVLIQCFCHWHRFVFFRVFGGSFLSHLNNDPRITRNNTKVLNITPGAPP